MNDNREFLNFIYQNAEMGKVTIPKVLEVVKEEPIRKHLQEQLEDYRDIGRQAEELMGEQGGEIKEVNGMQKKSAEVMAKMQTWMDDSSSHVAEMMIKGSNMGLIEIQKHLNQYGDAAPSIVSLAKRLERLEKRNLDALKPFLQ